MKLFLYSTAQAFLDDALDVLKENEAQNNLLISNALTGRTKAKPDWFFATVKDDEGGIRLSAVWTPPHNALIYETGNRTCDEAVALFARETFAAGIGFPGILAEAGLANRFSEKYAAVSGLSPKPKHNMNILTLEKVSELPAVPGHIRLVTEQDLYFAPYWQAEFCRDCGLPVPTLSEQVEMTKTRVDRKINYIWEDGTPVSQATCGRTTENVAVIGGVYTPPQYRGKGYATACVGALSMIMLARGYSNCALFADAENSISNKIYHNIGYRDISIYGEVIFVKKAETV